MNQYLVYLIVAGFFALAGVVLNVAGVLDSRRRNMILCLSAALAGVAVLGLKGIGI